MFEMIILRPIRQHITHPHNFLPKKRYKPFDWNVRVFEAVYNGAAMSLDGIVIRVHHSKQRIQSYIPNIDNITTVSYILKTASTTYLYVR